MIITEDVPTTHFIWIQMPESCYTNKLSELQTQLEVGIGNKISFNYKFEL